MQEHIRRYVLKKCRIFRESLVYPRKQVAIRIDQAVYDFFYTLALAVCQNRDIVRRTAVRYYPRTKNETRMIRRLAEVEKDVAGQIICEIESTISLFITFHLTPMEVLPSNRRLRMIHLEELHTLMPVVMQPFERLIFSHRIESMRKDLSYLLVGDLVGLVCKYVV